MITAKNIISQFTSNELEAISKVLGDTERGLTGAQIGQFLQNKGIPDCDPTNTKWKRLYNALASFQNEHKVGNHVITFINCALDPIGWTKRDEDHTFLRSELNCVLALCGYSVGEDGKVRIDKRATTIDEARERANRMAEQLKKRNVHSEVIRFCSQEIVMQNYFHAVFEAMKSVSARLRTLSGLSSDGNELATGALALGKEMNPRVAINRLATETERGEQKGFLNLLLGLYGTIRNPVAHEPKIEWDMTEQDALDILTTLSLVHRKLDRAEPRARRNP